MNRIAKTLFVSLFIVSLAACGTEREIATVENPNAVDANIKAPVGTPSVAESNNLAVARAQADHDGALTQAWAQDGNVICLFNAPGAVTVQYAIHNVSATDHVVDLQLYDGYMGTLYQGSYTLLFGACNPLRQQAECERDQAWGGVARPAVITGGKVIRQWFVAVDLASGTLYVAGAATDGSPVGEYVAEGACHAAN